MNLVAADVSPLHLIQSNVSDDPPEGIAIAGQAFADQLGIVVRSRQTWVWSPSYHRMSGELEQKGDRKFLPGGDLGPLFWQCRGARRCSSTAAWSLALSNGYDYAA